MRRALALLPELQRTVLELGYFEGLSSSEIAERVSAPIGTVKSRVAAALSKLRAGITGEAPRAVAEKSGVSLRFTQSSARTREAHERPDGHGRDEHGRPADNCGGGITTKFASQRCWTVTGSSPIPAYTR